MAALDRLFGCATRISLTIIDVCFSIATTSFSWNRRKVLRAAILDWTFYTFDYVPYSFWRTDANHQFSRYSRLYNCISLRIFMQIFNCNFIGLMLPYKRTHEDFSKNGYRTSHEVFFADIENWYIKMCKCVKQIWIEIIWIEHHHMYHINIFSDVNLCHYHM